MTMFRKLRSRVWIHLFMVLLMVGLFVVSCGKDDPTGITDSCPDGVTCHNSGLCCPATSPYYCSDKVDQSNGSTDGCFSSNCGNSCCKVQFEQCT